MFKRTTQSGTSNGKEDGFAMPNVHRRTFLKYAGMGAAVLSAGSVLSGCSSDDDTNQDGTGVSLGTGDVAVLNYAFALEQLEAAFYTQVVLTPYDSIPDAEMSLLTDIRNHEIAHREFFRKALGANAIGNLEVNFSSINFKSRDSVLATAKAFEDLGVAAYNGAGQYIKTPDYLVLAGKIVSVEARHAAFIRDLISNGTFSDTADNNGLDLQLAPANVFATASTYIKTKINTNTLPK
jgi:hypothetical protein